MVVKKENIFFFTNPFSILILFSFSMMFASYDEIC